MVQPVGRQVVQPVEPQVVRPAEARQVVPLAVHLEMVMNRHYQVATFD